MIRSSAGARHSHPRLAYLWLLTLALWLAQAAFGAVPAAAHAALEESTPAANAVLPSAPATVTLRFTERLERSYSKAELHDATGAAVPGTTLREGADAYEMVLDLPSGLANGTYSVLWRTLSMDDGHTAQGYVPFTIGTEADVRVIVPPAPVSTSGTAPVWLGVGARWLTYLGLAVALAVWPLWLFVLRPAFAPAWQIGPWLTRRVRRLATVGFALALLGSVASLVVQAINLSADGNVLNGLTVTLSETRYGTVWLLRLGTLLIYAASLFAVAWWWPAHRRLAAALALLLGLPIPVTFSLLSHAAAQPAGSDTAIAADALHLYSASLWAGGLLLLVATFLPTLRDLTATGQQVILSGVVPRFSRLALIAWAVMILTGVYAAWLEVGNLAALRETPYGQSLTVKLALILPLLALGAFNLFWVSRGVRRSVDTGAVTRWRDRFTGAVIAESLLVGLVLLVVGLLVSQPPGREVITEAAGRVAIPLASGEQQATLYIMPGTVGPNHYQLVLGDGHNHESGRGAPPVEALLRVELPGQETGQKQIDLVPALPGTYEAHGSEFSIAGDWAITAIVRQQGQPDWSASITQPIGLVPLETNVPPPPPRFGPAGIAGLLLVVVGLGGLVLALLSAGAPVRREAAGLGLIGLVLGSILLAQAQLGTGSVAATAGQPPLVAVDPAAVTRGAPLFAANCATCHGPAGKGDGLAAAGLNPPPADLTAIHAFAHTDDVYRYWIENGIAGTGMPAFSDQLAPEQVNDIIAYIRDLQNQSAVARDAPGAEGCLIAPRSLDQLAALAATPVAGTPPTPAPAVDTPVDQAVLDGLRATARELVACSNAGDSMRRLALYSDQRIRQSYPEGPTPALARLAEAPLPVRLEERVALINLDDVAMLADGRVAARVTIDNPLLHTHGLATPGVNPQADAARLIFVRQGDRWLIDGFLE